jgi:hypothetical protein
LEGAVGVVPVDQQYPATIQSGIQITVVIEIDQVCFIDFPESRGIRLICGHFIGSGIVVETNLDFHICAVN